MNRTPSFFSATGAMPVDRQSNYSGSANSGATTPQTSKGSASSSFYGLPSLRSAWAGLVRSFSYDDTQDPVSSTASTSITREVPPLDPVVLTGWKTSTRETSRVLNVPLAEEVRKTLPERLQIVDGWSLVYSLVQDGTLLATLYRKCADFTESKRSQRIGFVMAIRDEEGGVFGAYLSDIPHVSQYYYGNGECFLWRASRQVSLPPPPSADTTNLSRNTTIAVFPHTTSSYSSTRNSDSSLVNSNENTIVSSGDSVHESMRFKSYPYSGKNDYCILGEPGFLSLGAGDGHYGLWMNENLSRGHSDPCPTFDNERLSDQGGKFGIIGVEVWAIGG